MNVDQIGLGLPYSHSDHSMPEPVSAVGGSIWVTAGGSIGLVVGALGLTALGGVLLAKGAALVTSLCRRVQSSVKFSSHLHSGDESSQMPSQMLGRRRSDVKHSANLFMLQAQSQSWACSCSIRSRHAHSPMDLCRCNKHMTLAGQLARLVLPAVNNHLD